MNHRIGTRENQYVNCASIRLQINDGKLPSSFCASQKRSWSAHRISRYSSLLNLGYLFHDQGKKGKARNTFKIRRDSSSTKESYYSQAYRMFASTPYDVREQWQPVHRHLSNPNLDLAFVDEHEIVDCFQE